MSEESVEKRVGQFVTHVLPAWISAICAVCALLLTVYTLVVLTKTSNNVADIMNAMHGPAHP